LLLPVNCSTFEIKVLTVNALHAYKPLLLAVKTSQPRVSFQKKLTFSCDLTQNYDFGLI